MAHRTLAIVLLILPNVAAAKTWYLTPGDSIQETIDGAQPGDVIVLQEGYYAQDIAFDELDTDLTLRSETPAAAVITGRGAPATLDVSAGRNIHISGLTILPDFPDVDTVVRIDSATDVRIENCSIGGSAASQGPGEENPYSLLAVRGLVAGLIVENCDFGGFFVNQAAIRFVDISESPVAFTGNSLDCSRAGEGAMWTGAAVSWLGVNQDESNLDPGMSFLFERNHIHGIGAAFGLGGFMIGDTDHLFFRNNVIEADSSFSPLLGCYLYVDGDMGDIGVRSLVLANNTFSLPVEFTLIAVGSYPSSRILITNNLVDGSIYGLVHDQSDSITDCLIANNHATQMTGEWLISESDGWDVRNNIEDQPVVWVDADSARPYPYFELTEELIGGEFAWTPATDFLGRPREVPADAGAFEFVTGSTSCQDLGGYCCSEPTRCQGEDLGTTWDCTGVCCDTPCSTSLVVITTELPDAVLQVSYHALLEATGGEEPYAWVLESGALPPGLGLSAEGIISGSPAQTGMYGFSVQVADEGGQNASQSLEIEVLATSPCDNDLTDCNGTCVDLQTDPDNCGGCGNVCDLPHASAACVNGSCVVASCEAGRADCNLKPEDGCETVLPASGRCVQGGVVYEEIGCGSVSHAARSLPGLLVAAWLLLVLTRRRRT